MDHCWTVVVGFAFGSWFALSIISQFRPSWWNRIERHDIFALLPQWSFFAPNPGTHDIHLVFRDWCGSAHHPWVAIQPQQAKPWRSIWHPERFERKIVDDLANSLKECSHSTRDSPETLILSSAYLILLHWTMAQPRENLQATHRQFALIRSCGFSPSRKIAVELVSDVHSFQ
jgi:hypothetical protein